MRITKCDICKKVLGKTEDKVNVSVGFYSSFDICHNCAKPILKFLKDKKLIEENKKESSK
ncbi:MAG: hypothetical protein P4L62_04245 [Candidatus Pacebacteria bacterium]|nr:hypothetical protein [Candidatus Paceibacterota bacterium]